MAERYLRARGSSRLRLVLDARCDADVLLAAAYAVSGDEKKALALDIYGVIANERMTGAYAVADRLAGILRKRSYRADHHVIKRAVATDLCMTVLKWIKSPACPACAGHGHPLMLNSPVVDDSRECPACRGTGQIPLERIFRHEHVEHARWLVSHIESLTAIVFGDMARRLSNRMDF